MNDIDLSRRLSKHEVLNFAHHLDACPDEIGAWIGFMSDIRNRRAAMNAAWVLNHVSVQTKREYLTPHSNPIIDLAIDQPPFRRGLLLSIILEIADLIELRSDFIDSCFNGITDCRENDSCRAYMIHIAAKLCLRIPELSTELSLILEMLPSDIAPSILSAKRHALSKIKKNRV